MKHELFCRTRGQSRRRPDRRVVAQCKVVPAHELGDDQYRLGLSEASTDTGMGSSTKGNIRLLPIIRPFSCNKALRHESAGLLPVISVPVQRPRSNHHESTPLDLARPDLAIRHGDSRYKRDRWIQPKGFPKEGFYPGQLFHMLKLHGPVSNDHPDLLPQPRYPVWLDCQEIEHPGQRARRGFVAGEKKDAELVDQFLPREGLPGVYISRRNDITRYIIKNSPA